LWKRQVLEEGNESFCQEIEIENAFLVAVVGSFEVVGLACWSYQNDRAAVLGYHASSAAADAAEAAGAPPMP
jgi:hypothetical protein